MRLELILLIVRFETSIQRKVFDNELGAITSISLSD
jgi:hypothetical protein